MQTTSYNASMQPALVTLLRTLGYANITVENCSVLAINGNLSNWAGVSTDGSGFFCDTTGNLVGVSLRGINLPGSISTSVGLLTGLNVLELDGNQIVGTGLRQ
jgi:hypothetical protein